MSSPYGSLNAAHACDFEYDIVKRTGSKLLSVSRYSESVEQHVEVKTRKHAKQSSFCK